MQTVTTTAQTAAAIIASRKEKAAKTTKGLLIDGRPATFADLTAAQFNSAVNSVKFTIKGNARQQATDAVQDAISDAIADILAGTYVWDSVKGSFFICLQMRVKQLLSKGTAKTSYHREAVSYSQATGTDNEETEFNYAGADLLADEITDRKAVISGFLATFPAKEQMYITSFLEGLTDEQTAEKMGMTHSTFRVWKNRFNNNPKYAKYNFAEHLHYPKAARVSRAKFKK